MANFGEGAVQQLPPGQSYVRYGGGYWSGQPKLVNLIRRVSDNYYNKFGEKLQIGDMNAPGHQSHAKGIDADVSTPAANMKTTEYDKAKAQWLVDNFVKHGATQVVHSDMSLKNTAYRPDHTDSLHVRIEGPYRRGKTGVQVEAKGSASVGTYDDNAPTGIAVNTDGPLGDQPIGTTVKIENDGNSQIGIIQAHLKGESDLALAQPLADQLGVTDSTDKIKYAVLKNRIDVKKIMDENISTVPYKLAPTDYRAATLWDQLSKIPTISSDTQRFIQNVVGPTLPNLDNSSAKDFPVPESFIGTTPSGGKY